MGIQFDGTINLGHILTFIGILGVGMGFAFTLRNQINQVANSMSSLGERMKSAEGELKTISGVLVALGRQDERLNAMDRRLDDLQHGRGFVLDALPRAMKSG